MKKLALDLSWKHHLIEDNLCKPELKPQTQVKKVEVNFAEIRKKDLRDCDSLLVLAIILRGLLTAFIRMGDAAKRGAKNIDYGCILPGYVMVYYVLTDKGIFIEYQSHVPA